MVDAGMRQLYETGWMHNRGMVVASFLVAISCPGRTELVGFGTH